MNKTQIIAAMLHRIASMSLLISQCKKVAFSHRFSRFTAYLAKGCRSITQNGYKLFEFFMICTYKV